MNVGTRSKSWHTAGAVFLFGSTRNSEKKRGDVAYVLSLLFSLKSHKKEKKEDTCFQEMAFAIGRNWAVPEAEWDVGEKQTQSLRSR